MNIGLVRGALMIGTVLLALAIPSVRALTQSNEAKASTPSFGVDVSAAKHRYWRHRGGRHPHYGSRRLRTYSR